MKIVAVTGGIGSGKSVVSRILRMRGFAVVDTDSHAKAIMDADEEIKRRIADEICADAIGADGAIDRPRLAAVVFADAQLLARLNGIVHGKVRESIARMAADARGNLFVETAIFFQSGLNRMADAEWRVVCPDELRVERVMSRNGISRSQVLERIASQNFDPAPDEVRPPLTLIVNDGRQPILPQLDAALTQL